MDISLSDVARAKDKVLDALTDGDALRLSWEVERELGRTDTYYLTKYILGYDKLNGGFHRDLASFYDRYLWEPQIHLHPRGHYKTTILTVGGSVRIALLDPDTTILILMNMQENAKKVAKEIKKHFIENDKFRKLFPEHATQRRREEGQANAFTTPARKKAWIRSPTFEAASLSQRKVSNHYLHIKFDDIVDDDNCTTADLRLQTREGYAAALALCDGHTRSGLPWHHITGTRWHLDDAYHHILEEEKEKKKRDFRILITSAYYEAINPVSGAEERRLLFPEEFSWDRLMFIKEKYDRQGSNLFSCLYMNDPVPSEDAAMDTGFLKWYDTEDPEFKKKRLSTMIFADPSGAEKQSEGDPQAFTAASMDDDGNYYVREIRRGWWRLHDQVKILMDMWRAYRPHQVGVESSACQKWLGQELNRVKREESVYFETLEIKRDPKLRKPDRQKQILFPLRTGRIYLPIRQKESASIKALFQEMRGYPKGRHDDVLDTLSDMVEYMKAPPRMKRGPMEDFRMPPVVLRGNNPFQTGYSFRRGSYPGMGNFL